MSTEPQPRRRHLAHAIRPDRQVREGLWPRRKQASNGKIATHHEMRASIKTCHARDSYSWHYLVPRHRLLEPTSMLHESRRPIHSKPGILHAGSSRSAKSVHDEGGHRTCVCVYCTRYTKLLQSHAVHRPARSLLSGADHCPYQHDPNCYSYHRQADEKLQQDAR